MTQVPYSYVTLRYVHDMTTREFVNVGVVVFSPEAKFVGAMVASKLQRVKAMFPAASEAYLANLLSHIQAQVEILRTQIASDSRTRSPSQIESLVTAILPRDESCLQWGDVGGGISGDARSSLKALFERLVTRYERDPVTKYQRDPVVQCIVVEASASTQRTRDSYGFAAGHAGHPSMVMTSRGRVGLLAPYRARKDGDPVSG